LEALASLSEGAERFGNFVLKPIKVALGSSLILENFPMLNVKRKLAFAFV
jgi:hypothetical protein